MMIIDIEFVFVLNRALILNGSIYFRKIVSKSIFIH